MELLKPITIRKTEIANRVVLPAMHLNYTPGGQMTDRFIDFYELRAKNSVPLMIVGGISVDKAGGGAHLLGGDDDIYMPGLKKFMNVMHKYDTKIFGQLYQAGSYAYTFLTGGITPKSSSAHVSGFTKEQCEAMTLEEIEQVKKDFATTARRLVDCGFDGIEILGSAGYLICQFLSPLINKRTDNYGGTLENRQRLGVEIVQSVRAAVGDDIPICMRVAGNDFVKGSGNNDDTILFAQVVEKAGVDVLNVTGGWHQTYVPQLTMGVPEGVFTYLASNIRKNVSIPVITSNRINNPDTANRILADGLADMVAMGRSLIADAYLITKMKEGRPNDIVRCIACNQGCFDPIFEGGSTGCLVNPWVAYEGDKTLKKVSGSPKAAVIGAGPGGIYAAEILAVRGFDVTIFERESEIGGQINLALIPPERNDFGKLLESMHRKIEKNNINLILNYEATARELAESKFSKIVVATGSRPSYPGLTGEKLPNVVQYDDILTGKVRPGKRVVVIGGGPNGVETAIFVAEKGTISSDVLAFLFDYDAEDIDHLRKYRFTGNREVTLIKRSGSLGRGVGKSTKWSMLMRLKKLGVTSLVNTKTLAIEEYVVRIEQDGTVKELPYDTVILATGQDALTSIYDELKPQFGDNIALVGDAVSPRTALEAIREGFLAGMNI